MKHILIDIETLGRNAGCVVMSVAAVCFNKDFKDFKDLDDFKEIAEQPSCELFIEDFFSENLDVTEQLLRGYQVEPDTQQWWTKQSEAAKSGLLCEDPIPLYEFCERLQHFFQTNSDEEGVCVWSQGTDFDISILRKIFYDVLGPESEPWKHWNIRDSRTYILEIGKLFMDDPYKDLPRLKGEKHNALADARQSAFNVACVSHLLRQRLETKTETKTEPAPQFPFIKKENPLDGSIAVAYAEEDKR